MPDPFNIHWPQMDERSKLTFQEELTCKPGAAAQIMGESDADICCVYLHGFTASHREGEPLHEMVASALSANLFLTRLTGHGMTDPQAMSQVTAQDWVNDAVNAIAYAGLLSPKVVVIGSSLGASLALYIAALRPQWIQAIVALSPGIEPREPEKLDEYCLREEPIYDTRDHGLIWPTIWSNPTHPQGYRSLRDIMQHAMTETYFTKITTPIFLGYYYKDEQNQDQSSSVAAMQKMLSQLATPKSQITEIAYPDGAHILASSIKSTISGKVAEDVIAFLRRVL